MVWSRLSQFLKEATAHAKPPIQWPVANHDKWLARPLNSIKHTPKVDAWMTPVEGYLACSRSQITSNTCVFDSEFFWLSTPLLWTSSFPSFQIPSHSPWLCLLTCLVTGVYGKNPHIVSSSCSNHNLQIMNSKLLREICQVNEAKKQHDSCMPYRGVKQIHWSMLM